MVIGSGELFEYMIMIYNMFYSWLNKPIGCVPRWYVMWMKFIEYTMLIVKELILLICGISCGAILSNILF